MSASGGTSSYGEVQASGSVDGIALHRGWPFLGAVTDTTYTDLQTRDESLWNTSSGLDAGDVGSAPAGDVCEYVSRQAWSAWLGERSVSADPVATIELANGAACGYFSGEDLVRMAVAVESPHESDPLFPELVPTRAGTTSLDVAGQPATWTTQYPARSGSVLVVDGTTARVVIEVGNLGPLSYPEMRDGAVRFAEIALESAG